ncbi:hypothetical protein, partial [Cupriavidus sp. SK-4]|uniref:hypothetical protein n=1 Tax=Cupriavidus sp. SK-4 TaxID=574750 RepID=UPI000560ED0C
RQCARAGHASTPAPALAAHIDAAFAALATPAHGNRAVLAALATLRLALYRHQGNHHARH